MENVEIDASLDVATLEAAFDATLSKQAIHRNNCNNNNSSTSSNNSNSKVDNYVEVDIEDDDFVPAGESELQVVQRAFVFLF